MEYMQLQHFLNTCTSFFYFFIEFFLMDWILQNNSYDDEFGEALPAWVDFTLLVSGDLY